MAGPLGVDAAVGFTALAIEPVARWSSDDDITAYVAELGWNLPSVPSGLIALQGSAALLMSSLSDLLEAQRLGTSTTTAIAEVAGSLAAVIASIELLPTSFNAELPSTFLAATGIASQFEKRLLDKLAVGAISASSQTVRALLVAVGVIEEVQEAEVPDPDPANVQPAFLLQQLRLDRLSQLFSDPTGLLLDVYGWGSNQLNTTQLFNAIQELSFLFLVPPDVSYPSPQFLAAMFPGVPRPAGPPLPLLELPITGLGFPPLALGILPAPTASASDLQGIALRLLGTPALSTSLQLTTNLTLSLQSDFTLDTGLGVLLKPGQAPQIVSSVESGGLPAATGKAVIQIQRTDPDGPVSLFTFSGGSGLTAKSIGASLTLQVPPADLAVQAAISGGELSISTQEADGFLATVIGSGGLDVKFDFGVGWSNSRGVFFSGSAGLQTTLTLNISLGPILIDSIGIALEIDQGGLSLGAGVNADIAIGPVTASVDGMGVQADLGFHSGNLGSMDLGVSFKPPTGIGIAVDSGPVSGGGALTFDSANNRYFGAIELSIYSVSVKAFGVIETKLPTGPGYSFLIIISAEFTPIQLGFGFTLNGVGGLIGINRSVDSAGLLTMIKSGQLDNILFPDDVVDNAPAILNDVETLFPATSGHYVFGPLAKIGWGTPTLVDGELGLIIELPGPTLTVIGTVHAALPTQDEAVVELNLDVGGVLDFPNKKFSLDASLHDSKVGDYPISGDMAMRMNWGQNSNFAISVGGFNPHYNPPANFPKLKPVTIDLGVSGNPSVTLQGYMALTSNTAQVGALLQASASKDGASLSGFLGFDALFVFSPFSFEADIAGGVKVDFHGIGFTLTFHGTIAGPSPWTLNGQVCVSLLFASACVGFSLTLGGTSKPTLPGVDPWTGSTPNADGTQTVPGLLPAIQNVANWGGNPPAGSFASVTLVAPPAGTSASAPINPLGSATLRQKAVPLDLPITSFAGTQPTPSRTFDVTSVQIGPTGQATNVPEPARVKDYFAPAQFQQMKDAQKLSSQSFILLDAGFTISSDALTFGTPVPHGLIYTDVTFQLPIGTPPVAQPPIITMDSFPASQTHVTTVTGRSAAANGGLRLSAMAAFVDPTANALVTLNDELYSVANISNLGVAAGFPTSVPRPVATAAIDSATTTSATVRQTVQVAPTVFLSTSKFVL